MAHILLVEPDAILARAYQAALCRAGHTVDTAATAQAAVSLADQRRPDAVVLELHLPRHNGVEFLYEFRSYADWQAVPVLIHSMLSASEFAVIGQQQRDLLGIRAHLYKPSTSLAMLVQQVHGVLA